MLYNIEVGDKSNLDQILRVNKRIFMPLKKKSLIDKKAYQEILDKKKHLILNVKTGKMIVGNTIAFIRNKNYHIWIIALTTHQIRHGIAKKLLDTHKQLAKDNKFEAVTITVHDEQKDLIKIVEEEGFKVYRKSLKETTKDYKLEL